MQTIDRWRNWKTAGRLGMDENIEVSKVSEMSFDTFGPAIPAQFQNFAVSETMAADEPDAWRPEYEKWIRQACAFHDRCASGVASLHRSFAAWCIDGIEVCPCTRETFTLLLFEDGFEIRAGMVRHLVLVKDYRAVQRRSRRHNLEAILVRENACDLDARPLSAACNVDAFIRDAAIVDRQGRLHRE